MHKAFLISYTYHLFLDHYTIFAKILLYINVSIAKKFLEKSILCYTFNIKVLYCLSITHKKVLCLSRLTKPFILVLINLISFLYTLLSIKEIKFIFFYYVIWTFKSQYFLSYIIIS